MNNKVAAILKGYIETLSWTDKIAGLVQTANIKVKTGEGSTEKSYPIACDIDIDDCLKGHYQDLAPDESKKSVMYFEDRGGVTFDRREGNRLYYTANLRLIGWINLKLINEADCEGQITDCGSSGDYVIEVIKALPQYPFDAGGLFNINVLPPTQVERSVDIFSRYTYNETATQYLMFPFDYFALDLTVNFMIPCVNPRKLINGWFLPSLDETDFMRTVLYLFGLGEFTTDPINSIYYWTSTEQNQNNAMAFNFGDGSDSFEHKDHLFRVRAIRAFTSVNTSYAIRDIGPGGGYVFYKDGDDYLEAAPSDQSSGHIWHWINEEIGVTAQGTAIGTGKTNSIAILSQTVSEAGATIATVGTSGDYSTLQEALKAVYEGNLMGDVILRIISDIEETTQCILYQDGYNGTADYNSVIIYPTLSGLEIKTAFNFGMTYDSLILLDGASNVTIDGRVNRSGDPDMNIINDENGKAIEFANSPSNIRMFDTFINEDVIGDIQSISSDYVAELCNEYFIFT